MEILNLTIQLLAYSDYTGQTDNPTMRSFDWTRRFSGLSISDGKSNKATIAPGESLTLFDGVVSHGLTTSSVLDLLLLSQESSRYRMSVTSGPSGFRTPRSPSGIVNCTVTINNNAMATFDFTGATLTGIVVGDTMRIKGSALYDTAPFVFSSINSGLWKIIGVQGTKVYCIRPTGISFSGIGEVVSAVSGDVMFFSSSGVQAGDKIKISGTFSPVTQKTFVVMDVTPTTLDIMSAESLPDETGLTYVASSVDIYSESKRLLYIESDQDVAVRINTDASDNEMINPIEAGKPCMVGVFMKWGNTYKCVLVNKSINTSNVLWITGE